MRLSLRARLTLWFGLTMALALAVFGLITFTSVSNELYTNLDASLNQVIASLDLIIREQSKPAEDEEQSRAKGREGKGEASTMASCST